VSLAERAVLHYDGLIFLVTSLNDIFEMGRTNSYVPFLFESI
jgi:hypothetical protein